MSLRARLVAALAVVLALSIAIGCALAGWHARRAVRLELTTALAVGEQTARTALSEAAEAPDPEADVRRLVGTFDGNRHVRAALLGADGQVVLDSRSVRPVFKAPRWFRRLVAPSLDAVDLGEARRFPIRLSADPANEVGEVWSELRDVATVLALFCLLAPLLVFWTVNRALRPLDRLRSGLARVGAGDYASRIAEDGPPELAALARGFNGMAARLSEAQRRNDALNEQLLTLQEEERADLARDLHDEIGPSLFAVTVTAATIRQLADARRVSEIGDQARSIQDVVVHVQRYVRAMLSRLRAVRPIELGLGAAIETLAAFWRERYPHVAFEVDAATDEADIDDATKEVVYRIVQEGLANAVRHGRPSRVGVVVRRSPDAVAVEVADDGASSGTLSEPGFGLSGMRERVSARGGTLSIEPGTPGSGWRVRASLPVLVPA